MVLSLLWVDELLSFFQIGLKGLSSSVLDVCSLPSFASVADVALLHGFTFSAPRGLLSVRPQRETQTQPPVTQKQSGLSNAQPLSLLPLLLQSTDHLIAGLHRLQFQGNSLCRSAVLTLYDGVLRSVLWGLNEKIVYQGHGCEQTSPCIQIKCILWGHWPRLCFDTDFVF